MKLSGCDDGRYSCVQWLNRGPDPMRQFLCRGRWFGKFSDKSSSVFNMRVSMRLIGSEATIDSLAVSNDKPNHDGTTTVAAKTSLPNAGAIEFTGAMGALLEREKSKLYAMVLRNPKERDIFSINQFLENLQKSFPPSMHLYNIILRAHILLNDKEGIRKVLSTIKDHGFTFNLITYNLMISYYRDRESPSEAEQLLLKMVELGIKPNQFTYTTLISAYAKTSIDKARQYFQMACKDKPDIFSYNAMIRSCIQHERYAEADELIVEMGKAGITPNYVTFKSLTEGLCSAGRIADAVKLYETTLAGKREIRIGDYSEICRWFWMARAKEQAIQVASDMETYIGHMDQYAVTRCLLQALSQDDLTSMNRLLDKYVEPSLEKYSNIIKKLVLLAQDRHNVPEPVKERLLNLLAYTKPQSRKLV